MCVEATDKLDPLKRVTPTNRELIAQGAGNIAAGFVGGLPITQVIVRSSANIQSGGRTKLVAFLHGVLNMDDLYTIMTWLGGIGLAVLLLIYLPVWPPSFFRWVINWLSLQFSKQYTLKVWASLFHLSLL